MGFLINQAVRNLALLPMLMIPDRSTRAQHGAVDGHCSSILSPRIDQADQILAKVAYLDAEPCSQLRHFGGRLSENGQQFMNAMQVMYDHDDQGF